LSKEGTLVPWVKGDALACGGGGKILLRAKIFLHFFRQRLGFEGIGVFGGWLGFYFGDVV